MRIYKMTATFGKLERATLTLEPGLNVITAPNEWGKSTWCAFLAAMFYGLDTRAKSTKTALSDKEHYAPWSGAPMEGHIDLNWQGRDITIERRTRQRVPLGDFRAYETASGLKIPELTAANCGQTLLGVEQTVFRRSSFIRLADMPVTQDEALRRRLNALVTTGDDSGAADHLAAELKDLRNKCRFNKTGLLPQAESRRSDLSARLAELQELQSQSEKLTARQESLNQWFKRLKIHQKYLEYAAAEENVNRMAKAREARDQTAAVLQGQELRCAALPQRQEAEERTRELRKFREEWNALSAEHRTLPQAPAEPQLPPPFTGMTAQEARAMARKDAEVYVSSGRAVLPTLLAILGLIGLMGAVALMVLKIYLPGALAAAAALAIVAWGVLERKNMKKQGKGLLGKYRDPDPGNWTVPIDNYEHQMEQYMALRREYQDVSGDVEVRYMVMEKRRAALCGAQEPEDALDAWQQVLGSWDALDTARREAERAQSYYETICAMVRPAEKPEAEDTMTSNEEETEALLRECLEEQQRCLGRLGQIQGRMEALGDKKALEESLAQLERRIAHLEQTYTALTIAQETLAQARAELQRRFAPRISKRAQELLGRMTGGRYETLNMGEDFSLQAGTAEETTLRDALWRSDGTMDQLYLALRLAVSEELTKDAPIILDDALVRFDDRRMASAMEILKELAGQRQIILFTCQGREANV